MNLIEEFLITNKFYHAFLNIIVNLKIHLHFYIFFKYINILSSFQSTPQLKAFENMIRDI